MMKDECCAYPIKSAIALKSKCYIIKTLEDKTKNTLKGIKKCVKNTITFDDYKDILYGDKILYK